MDTGGLPLAMPRTSWSAADIAGSSDEVSRAWIRSSGRAIPGELDRRAGLCARA